MHISQTGTFETETASHPSEPFITRASQPVNWDLEGYEQLEIRQADLTCGFINFSTTWEPWDCSMGACRTIGNYFDCGGAIYTACLPSTICATAVTTKDREVCCDDRTFPACLTGYKSSGDTQVTGFRCAKATVRGDYSVYERPTTSTVITTTSERTPTTTPTTLTVTASDPASTTSGSDGPSSKTPVGAIVGGVIGGVALLALIGLGFWYMRWRDNKKKDPEPPQPQLQMDYQPERQPEYQPDYAPEYRSMGQVSPPPPPHSPGQYPYQPSPGFGQYPYPPKSEIPQSPTSVEMSTDNPRDCHVPIELATMPVTK